MKEEMRINKYFSEMGICSRREADRLIEAGRVTVDGRKAEAGDKVTGDETIILDGVRVGSKDGMKKTAPAKVVLAVNKPRGVVCSSSDNDRAENIVDMVHYPERVYTIGRLDKDSEGLILMTNDGELANRITKTAGAHEKEYIVKTSRPIREDALTKMRGGMYLKELNKSTLPCRIERIGDDTFSIILTQGLNRQIRRMCEDCGYKVVSLKRIRIMNVQLGHLKSGCYRRIKGEELKELGQNAGTDQQAE